LTEDRSGAGCCCSPTHTLFILYAEETELATAQCLSSDTYVQVCVKQKVQQGHKKSEGKVVNGKILYFQVSRQRYPAAVTRSFVFLVAFVFVFVFIIIAEEIEENGEEKDKFFKLKVGPAG
jgi:hypothetical protein